MILVNEFTKTTAVELKVFFSQQALRCHNDQASAFAATEARHCCGVCAIATYPWKCLEPGGFLGGGGKKI